MAFSFFSKKNNVETQDRVSLQLFLALDIGTEFVKSALYQVKNGSAEIVGYSQVKQHSKAMEGAMIINIEHVCSACDRGIGEALSVADKILGVRAPFPEYVTLGISGELVKGVTINANYERENPDETITQEELDEVVESVKKQAFPDSIEEIASEIGTSPHKIKEINSHIDATYIDGTKVDNPLGFAGKEVMYKVFSTFAPSIHVNSLLEIAKRLELQLLTIDTQPYAIAKAFKGSHRNDFSSIFIDIGGGTTDIALVQDGGIVGTKMFAFGGRVFTRRLARDLNLDMHEAEKLKLDYSTKQLQEITEKKVKKALNKDNLIWAEGIEISLAEFEEVESYPSEILLCGGGSELPDIKETLLAYPWLTVLPFTRFPKVNHIYPGQIENVQDKTGLMIRSCDVAAAALVSISVDLI